MNADAFRHLFGYHFAQNRAIWDSYITALSEDQFTQEAPYSRGSIRNQIAHIMSTDDAWFSGLRGRYELESPIRDDLNDRKSLRAHGDAIEQMMREYLAALSDAMLLQKPFGEPEDKDVMAWQALLHVVNHGTDHRAQLLRSLNDMGIKTGPQDYIFYIYEHPST